MDITTLILGILAMAGLTIGITFGAFVILFVIGLLVVGMERLFCKIFGIEWRG
jgi:hypothetical protein